MLRVKQRVTMLQEKQLIPQARRAVRRRVKEMLPLLIVPRQMNRPTPLQMLLPPSQRQMMPLERAMLEPQRAQAQTQEATLALVNRPQAQTLEPTRVVQMLRAPAGQRLAMLQRPLLQHQASPQRLPLRVRIRVKLKLRPRRPRLPQRQALRPHHQPLSRPKGQPTLHQLRRPYSQSLSRPRRNRRQIIRLRPYPTS